jgi:hypothetical protein
VARIAIGDILDPAVLPVMSTPVPLGYEGEGPPALVAGDDAVVVGLGRTLVVLDPADLSVRLAIDLPLPIEALTFGDRGLVAAGDGRVIELGTDFEVVAGTAAPAGLGTVVRIVTD